MSFISIQRMPRFQEAPLNAAEFIDICIDTCKRLPAMRRTADAKRLDDLVAAGAWTDAALTLIAIELPAWQLRRLAHDEGEWHCTLSCNRQMPDWLDDTVDARHTELARAVLGTFFEAMRRDVTPQLRTARSTPETSETFEPMICENYV